METPYILKPYIFKLALLASLLSTMSASAQEANTIYHSGSILTMSGEEPTYVEALVVENGKIVFTGTKDEALAMKGDGTKLIDLKGKALPPASSTDTAITSTHCSSPTSASSTPLHPVSAKTCRASSAS
jgi:hypothetical protein